MNTKPPSKMLVVDDDQTIRQFFSIAMAREGYEVFTASSGLEGLRMATENGVNVVLLDIKLPDQSGLEILHQMVRTTEAVVILMTGDDTCCSYESAVEQGAADFILKPVRIAELTVRIRQALVARSLMVAKERQIADLERMAVRDALTGLYNYRHFQNQFKSEGLRSVRYRRPLSMILMDVDHFKTVNDSLGHSEGDRVLKALAAALVRIIRGADSAFRYGGDEFVIVLPETSVVQALALAERIRKGIEDAELVKGARITVSAGVTEFLPDEDADAFMQRADLALYAAKRGGRNRVVQGLVTA